MNQPQNTYYKPKFHKQGIIARFGGMMDEKYDKGQEEHGGQLWEKPVLKFMLEEVMDLPIYLLTFMDQIEQVKALLKEGLEAQDLFHAGNAIKHALNILEKGNQDGKKLDN